LIFLPVQFTIFWQGVRGLACLLRQVPADPFLLNPEAFASDDT
jgi:hypothetical protein